MTAADDHATLARSADRLVGNLITIRRLMVVIAALILAGGLAVIKLELDARTTSRAARHTLAEVRSCTTATGKCAKAARAAQQARDDAARAALAAGQAQILDAVRRANAEQLAAVKADADRLLAAVNSALTRLDQAHAEQAALRRELADARAQLAALSAEIARQRATPPGQAPAPPTHDVCVALGVLGALVGC
ncbi:MAG TPA: hypothetical protein VFJ85_02790 [Acidimicrobiales bacterium]|nr:hypothetical protein [Acidimicrobiales bacterium]